MPAADPRARLAEQTARLAAVPGDAATALQAAALALDAELEEEALPAVARAAAAAGDPALWQMLGLLHRAVERSGEAIRAFAAARRLAPAEPRIAHALALATHEAGLPATPLYEQALRLAPRDDRVRLGRVAALAAEGEADRALAALGQDLRARPAWIDGHHAFARLSATVGRPPAASLDEALGQHPADVALHAARLAVLSRIASPEERLRAVARAREIAGAHAVFQAEEAVAASEAGDLARADRAFLALGRHDDPQLGLALLRHLVRARRFDQAEVVAARLIEGPDPVSAWAYRHIVWRATGDHRLAWLEQGGAFVRSVPLAASLPPLEQLAGILRRLHLGTAQPLDQSVRGGTQSDGPLFARIEPEIGAVRAAALDAVKDYRASLGGLDPAHPLLRLRRDRRPRFAGSWSVRLMRQGHHANHIHAQGWLSSALHVALPATPEASGQGFLTIGAPPAELGLGLGPTRSIRPEAGRLVLFPSWLWHGVTPFQEGERLTIAFDVAPPDVRHA